MVGGFILRILSASADPTPEEPGPAHRVAGPVRSGQAGLITRPKSRTTDGMSAKQKKTFESLS